MSETKPETMVHALDYDYAICAFDLGYTKDWPEGHSGVDLQRADEVTCLECRKQPIFLRRISSNKGIEQVHILLKGSPICKFTKKAPSKFPDGHRWVGPKEHLEVTCPGCRRAFETIHFETPEPTEERA